MKLFFATDIHGSDLCFRKFFSAIREYRADIALLAGDLSGKLMVPIEEKNGTYLCSLYGAEVLAKNATELADLEKKIANMGFYSYIASPSEIEELHKNPEKGDEVFGRLIAERLNQWVRLADQKLRASLTKVYIGPGNDDPLTVDSILESSERMTFLDEKAVDTGGYEVITTAFSNPTPWNTPRECDEQGLMGRIDRLASMVKTMKTTIFNFHVPPYGTLLDVAPKLRDMEPVPGSVSSVGSLAVKQAINRYQPLLGLHGHIHESKAAQRFGRTLCVNPGSEYSEGILRGVLLTLDNDRIKSHIFTSG